MEEGVFKGCVYRINFKNDQERVENIRSLMAKLDSEGWDSHYRNIKQFINFPRYVYLWCFKCGIYALYDNEAGREIHGYPLHEYPQPTQNQAQ